jgi:hypothetical protein
MTFKKVTQIIWMVLAVLFLAIMALRVYEESSFISSSADGTWLKFNKISGKLRFFDLGDRYEWRAIDKKAVEAAKVARQASSVKDLSPLLSPLGKVLEKYFSYFVLTFKWMIPAGFVLDAPQSTSLPPLPPGFVLEKEQPSSPKMTFEEFYFKEKARVQKELEEAKKQEAKKGKDIRER